MKYQFLFSFLLLGFAANAVPLCDDLAKFACAPGRYDDGTGVVKSESEVREQLRTFADNTRASLHDDVLHMIRQPSSEFFRDNALSVFGLKDSPTCQRVSADASLPSACEDNLVEGLVELLQQQTMGSLVGNNGINRKGNTTDLQYVLRDQNFVKLYNRIQSRADNELIDHQLVNKIRDQIFPEVKALIMERIGELKIPDDKKRFMISKINGIQFQGVDCTAIADDDETHIDVLLESNAFYSPSSNTFRFCNGYVLQSTSVFQIVTSIAHELTHSLDPCNINRGPQDVGFHYTNSDDLKKSEAENPFSNVVQCLRSPDSIHAVNLLIEYPKLASELAPKPTAGSEPAPPLKPSLCSYDQITESFPDWMAGEVLPRYIERHYQLTQEQYQTGYGNTRRLICGDQKTNPNHPDPHPLIKDRINRIFLPNPHIRAQLGCTAPPTAKYCSSEKTGDPAAEGTTGAPTDLNKSGSPSPSDSSPPSVPNSNGSSGGIK
jgi:hypothetical protein